MVQNKAHKLYAQQQIMTASPAKLVWMLYDHAIAALRDAIKAIEENDIEKRWKANNKACEIIGHLWATLDVDGGGVIAQNLDQLFGFMMTKLPEVDFRNNPQPALDVIKLLEPLREAWKELAMKSESELAQASHEARQSAAATAASSLNATETGLAASPAPAQSPPPSPYGKSKSGNAISPAADLGKQSLSVSA